MNKKYIFETNFDDPGQKLPDKSLDEAFAAGHKAGVDEAMQSIERHTAEICNAILKQMHQLAAGFQSVQEGLTHKSLSVLLVALEKIIPQGFDKFGGDEIAAAANKCFEIALQMPKMTIKISPDNQQTLAPKLMQIAEQAGFSGKILISPDPNLGRSDCRIEWGNGGMDHLPGKSWDDIRSIIQSCIPAPVLDSIPPEEIESIIPNTAETPQSQS